MGKKKSRYEEYEETPIRYGVYKNRKTGKIAIATKSEESERYDWVIDKGVKKQHPFFRVKLSVVAEGTGNFFFNKDLKNFDFLTENTEGYVAGQKIQEKEDLCLK
jgi:hypothetical protein